MCIYISRQGVYGSPVYGVVPILIHEGFIEFSGTSFFILFQGVNPLKQQICLFFASKKEMGVYIIRSYFPGGVPEGIFLWTHPYGSGFEKIGYELTVHCLNPCPFIHIYLWRIPIRVIGLTRLSALRPTSSYFQPYIARDPR